MSNQITDSFVDQFSTGITMLSQQMSSSLRGSVSIMAMTAKKMSFDQVGAIRLQEKMSRHADIDQTEVPHKRRWVSARPYWARDFIDESDTLELLNNPTNAYTQAFAAAAARRFDRVTINGLLGENLTGEDGDEKVALPAAQIIADGGTGFTFAKLKKGVRMLRSKNALNLPGDTIHIALTAKQEEEYIDQNEVKSRDFTMMKVIDDGGVTRHYRVNFHYIEDEDESPEGVIIPKTGNVRSLPMWVRSGAVVGMRKDAYGRVAWLDQGEKWQVSGGINMGASRREEVKVVQIDVQEAA